MKKFVTASFAGIHLKKDKATGKIITPHEVGGYIYHVDPGQNPALVNEFRTVLKAQNKEFYKETPDGLPTFRSNEEADGETIYLTISMNGQSVFIDDTERLIQEARFKSITRKPLMYQQSYFNAKGAADVEREEREAEMKREQRRAQMANYSHSQHAQTAQQPNPAYAVLDYGADAKLDE